MLCSTPHAPGQYAAEAVPGPPQQSSRTPARLARPRLQPKDMGLPVHAYLARDEVREDGTEKSKKVFVNLPTEVGATEAEEIGVEHLLRDVKDASISTLSSEVGAIIQGHGRGLGSPDKLGYRAKVELLRA